MTNFAVNGLIFKISKKLQATISLSKYSNQSATIVHMVAFLFQTACYHQSLPTNQPHSPTTTIHHCHHPHGRQQWWLLVVGGSLWLHRMGVVGGRGEKFWVCQSLNRKFYYFLSFPYQCIIQMNLTIATTNYNSSSCFVFDHKLH